MIRALRHQLAAHQPTGRRSDFDLLGEGLSDTDEPAAMSYRDAAVLVPVVAHAEPTILLTRRSSRLKKHAGQVSFPGGRIDPGDPDAAAAALRETQEEIGVGSQHIELVGRLDEYRTGSGFVITPFVGVLTPGFSVMPEPGEVEAVFEVPLAFILDRRNHQRRSAHWQGRERSFFAMPYGDHQIWGATAAMLVNLCDVLEAGGVLHPKEKPS